MRISLLVVVALALVSASRGPDVPVAQPNDNRQPAGTRHGDTLVLDLEVRMARWYPEANDGPFVVVPAFAVNGGVPTIPAPLIRVSRGTQLDVTVHNALADSAVTVHGLVTRPGADDSVTIAPGASQRVRFAAGAPGTYLYRASAGARFFTDAAGRTDSLERDQLVGAFIVDSGPVASNDRVFVMNLWGEPREPTEDSPEFRHSAITINGKSWPYTERLSFASGDSVHWRWINGTGRFHPMHLHGFYFRVDSEGRTTRDSTIAAEARRMAVTEEMRPYDTRTFAWLPTRPGHWLFHCHALFHVTPPGAVLDTTDAAGHHADHMAGLVMGLDVRPAAGWTEPARANPRQLTLRIAELTPRGRRRAIGVDIAEGSAPGATGRTPGPLLVLTRNQPTDVTVINGLAEATSIHWHGLELESHSDGVAGWSGDADHIAPPIPAGGTFVAHLSQPRAGTFIYHTHLHDLKQLTAGLYGAIVVLPEGQTFDAAHDHVFVLGWNGTRARPPNFVLNGDSTPAPLVLASGVAHRLRFVGIGAAGRLRIAVRADSAVARWRPISTDGADLAPARAVAGPATTVLTAGSTLDVEFLPPAPGTYRLTIGPAASGAPILITQLLVVR